MALLHSKASSRPTNWDLSDLQPQLESRPIYLDLQAEKFHFESLDTASSLLGADFTLFQDKIFESESLKYLLLLDHQFSHVLHDSLTLILKLYSIDRSSIFVLYQPRNPLDGVKMVYEYVEELLTHMQVNYVMVPNKKSMDGPRYSAVIETSNYIDIRKYISKKNLNLSLDDYLNTSNEIGKHIGEPYEAPHRNVYLSRSHIDRIDYSAKVSNIKEFPDDTRMEDESLLEDFFKRNNFEIVIPEKKFIKFSDQLRYMSSIKVLASVTGSGLLNSLFMQEGQVVLEIVAELVTQGGADQGIANNYTNYAYIKNHTYLGIPSRRRPEPVIDRLESFISPIIGNFTKEDIC